MMTAEPVGTKTKVLAHYIVAHTDPECLGATKLNKVMWKADVVHYRKYGRSISGQISYVRMQNGPVPNGVNETLKALEAEGSIVERQTPTPVGARREFVWLTPAPVSCFTAEEIEAIHQAIEIVCPMSARRASDSTHGPLWNELRMGEQMSIQAASVIPEELQPEDIEWALSESWEDG